MRNIKEEYIKILDEIHEECQIIFIKLKKEAGPIVVTELLDLCGWQTPLLGKIVDSPGKFNVSLSFTLPVFRPRFSYAISHEERYTRYVKEVINFAVYNCETESFNSREGLKLIKIADITLWLLKQLHKLGSEKLTYYGGIAGDLLSAISVFDRLNRHMNRFSLLEFSDICKALRYNDFSKRISDVLLEMAEEKATY